MLVAFVSPQCLLVNPFTYECATQYTYNIHTVNGIVDCTGYIRIAARVSITFLYVTILLLVHTSTIYSYFIPCLQSLSISVSLIWSRVPPSLPLYYSGNLVFRAPVGWFSTGPCVLIREVFSLCAFLCSWETTQCTLLIRSGILTSSVSHTRSPCTKALYCVRPFSPINLAITELHDMYESKYMYFLFSYIYVLGSLLFRIGLLYGLAMLLRQLSVDLNCVAVLISTHIHYTQCTFPISTYSTVHSTHMHHSLFTLHSPILLLPLQLLCHFLLP